MIFFNQKKTLKAKLCLIFFFSGKSEFVKLKAEVRGIIIFYSYFIFSSKKNVANRISLVDSCIKC